MEFRERREEEEGEEGEEELILMASPSPSSSVCLCRICHEEEDERITAMESPCACSGTLKFAHRGCIQRWCEEKGSILCEICLQKFEPGYIIPPKKALIDVQVTIRRSLEVHRSNYNHNASSDDDDDDDDDNDDYSTCSIITERSFSYCRWIALMCTVLLLLRHLVAVLSVGTDECRPFTLLTVFALRASGIVLPFYLTMKMISAIQKMQLQQYHEHIQLPGANNSSISAGEEDDPQHHVIDIHS